MTPDAMSLRTPLLLGLGGRENQGPNLVRLQLGKGTVLINYGLSCGQRSFMSTLTACLGCREASPPQPGSSRVFQTPPKVQLTCLHRGVSVCLGGQARAEADSCAGGNSAALGCGGKLLECSDLSSISVISLTTVPPWPPWYTWASSFLSAEMAQWSCLSSIKEHHQILGAVPAGVSPPWPHGDHDSIQEVFLVILGQDLRRPEQCVLILQCWCPAEGNVHFWGHPTVQPLVSCGMMSSRDGVSAWVMPISPAAAWLEQTILALMSSEAGAGSVGAGGILAHHQEKLMASTALP